MTSCWKKRFWAKSKQIKLRNALALLNGSYNIKAGLSGYQSYNYIASQRLISQNYFLKNHSIERLRNSLKSQLTDISVDTEVFTLFKILAPEMSVLSKNVPMPGKITRWHSQDMKLERSLNNIRNESDFGQHSFHCLDEDPKAQSGQSCTTSLQQSQSDCFPKGYRPSVSWPGAATWIPAPPRPPAG